MKIKKFSLVIDGVLGVQLRLHWTILLSLAVFSGFKFEPFYCLAFFAIILVHEIGHAIIVKLFSFELHELIVHGAGGACVWSGPARDKHIYSIAWGGILAQLLFFIIFVLISETLAFPNNAFIEQTFRAFIGTNLFLMLINLLPVQPLDGAEAWKIFKPMLRDLKNKQKHKKSDQLVQNQIKQIFKENEGTPNNSSQRTRSPRR
jgi:Zn-dependent protease